MGYHALLIGIDFYRDAARLSSCVNDVNEWTKLLLDEYSFQKENVRCLTTVKQTTKEFISARLTQFLKNLGDGDFGMLIFSGHGGRFEVTIDGEKMISGGLRCSKGILYEHELRGILKDHFNPSSKLVSILDSCHSGSMELLGTSPGPFDHLEIKTGIRKPVHKTLEGSQKQAKQVLRPQHKNQILLTACRQMESAYGAVFNGKMNGVFTHYLIKTLRANPRISFWQFLVIIEKLLPDEARGYMQTPQYFGKTNTIHLKIIQ